MRERAPLAVLALALGLAPLRPAAAEFAASGAGDSVINYLYVEPNEGGSSGGHTAVGLGTHVYHFQHSSEGLLSLVRDDAKTFEHRYGTVGNRDIHLARLTTDPAVVQRLEADFIATLARQRTEAASARAIESYVEVADALAEAVDGDRSDRVVSIRLRGAGLFAPFGSGREALGLVRLRGLAERRHGASFLADRITSIEAQLRALHVPDGEQADWSIEADAKTDALERPAARFARALYEGLALRHGLQLLASATPLAPDATIRLDGPDAALDAALHARLERYRSRLEAQVLRLLSSTRPDAGFPLMLALARLEVIGRSLETGERLHLDGMGPGATRLPASLVRRRQDVVAALSDIAQRDDRAARVAFMEAARLDEASYARLERTANRWAAIERARGRNADLRIPSAAPVPQWEGDVFVAPDVLPRASTADVRSLARHVQASERRLRETRRERDGYHLVTRNCVTELLRAIERAASEPSGSSLLGRGVAPDGLDFVPAISVRTIGALPDVERVEILPSHRNRQLSLLRARAEGSIRSRLALSLRESNTLTSSLYRRGFRDSSFVFFTDQSLLPRPLFGAVNLTAALGEVVWGTALAAQDRGYTLKSGLRGVAMSLPELLFVNVRKGTNEALPRP